MWVSRKEFDDLRGRVSELEFDAREQKRVNDRLASFHFKPESPWFETHSMGMESAIHLLAEHLGVKFYREQQSTKLVKSKS